MATVNQSRLITNLTALIHNRAVAAYIKNELKNDIGSGDLRGVNFGDTRNKGKAIATALIIKKKDAPILATSKMTAFHLLFDKPWEHKDETDEFKLRGNFLPCVVIQFREKLKSSWGRDTYQKKIYFPNDAVVNLVKQGKAPNLPPLKMGKYSLKHVLKNGTFFIVNAKSIAEAKAWVVRLQKLTDKKWENPTIREPIIFPQGTGDRIVYPRTIKYYPNGLDNPSTKRIGYF